MTTVTKPFGMQEFMARVSNATSANETPVTPAYLVWYFTSDLVQRRVRFQGEFIDLTPQNLTLYVAQASGEAAVILEELLRQLGPILWATRTIDATFNIYTQKN